MPPRLSQLIRARGLTEDEVAVRVGLDAGLMMKLDRRRIVGRRPLEMFRRIAGEIRLPPAHVIASATGAPIPSSRGNLRKAKRPIKIETETFDVAINASTLSDDLKAFWLRASSSVVPYGHRQGRASPHDPNGPLLPEWSSAYRRGRVLDPTSPHSRLPGMRDRLATGQSQYARRQLPAWLQEWRLIKFLRSIAQWFLNGDYGVVHLVGASIIFDIHPWYVSIAWWLGFCVVVAVIRALVNGKD